MESADLDPFDVLAVAAARLRSDGKVQNDIAEQLGVSQAKVSRLLEHARQREWLVPTPRLVRAAIPDALWDRSEEKFFSAGPLTERLVGLAPAGVQVSARVISAADRAEFSRLAAPHLGELLRRSEWVGVLWGRTLQAVIERLRDVPPSPPRTPPLRPVPGCGEPLFLSHQENVGYSASLLARELGDRLGSRAEDVPTLTGVPAYIPRRFDTPPGGATNPRKGRARPSCSLREFISQIPGYRRLFGSGRIIERMDTILTGVGMIDADEELWGTFIRERLRMEEGLTADRLRKAVLGDIGGVLLERPGAAKAERQLVDDLNRGWLGIQRADYERVARVASQTGRPGVVVLAQGKAKARLLRELVCGGLVNYLIIDAAARDALLAPGG